MPRLYQFDIGEGNSRTTLFIEDANDDADFYEKLRKREEATGLMHMPDSIFCVISTVSRVPEPPAVVETEPSNVVRLFAKKEELSNLA